MLVVGSFSLKVIVLYYPCQQLSVDESEITVVKRKYDDRSLDEKLYRMRYVIQKEFDNTRDPVNGLLFKIPLVLM